MTNNDCWVVQTPKQAAQVPNGSYMAVFKGVEDMTLKLTSPKEGDKGERCLWKWEVKSGSETGKIATALTEKGKINPNALPGKLIAGLLGRALVDGESVKDAIDGCIGKSYLVVVQPGPKGGKPGVRTVTQPPQM